MKKTLYLMRHRETLFNQLNKIQGACDSPLTETGLQQAQIAKEYFKNNEIVFDDAHCSTSERAADTLECVTDLPYTRLKGLKEWHFGLFEGEPCVLQPAAPYGEFFVPFGGESEAQLEQRMVQTLTQMMKNTAGTTVLAVSHGAFCRHFMQYWSPEPKKNIRLSNCGILKFTYHEDETFELLEIVHHDFQQKSILNE
ncbi:histidine phosphatase family protein [Enterococcus olivae]